MAVYPGAVRTYSTKRDQITTVDANDVNALQDELGATQQTLGVNPHIYAPVGSSAVVYANVGARLDHHDTTLLSLQTQISNLVTASANGWNTPVLSLSQGGVTPNRLTLPGPANFGLINWTSVPVQDPFRMWSGGSHITSVLGGWYHIDVGFSAAVDEVALSSAQNVLNASALLPVPIAFQDVIVRFHVNGSLVKQHASHIPYQPVYLATHLPTVSYDGPLHQGDVLTVQIGQYNGTCSGVATLTATYVRPVPGI